MKILCCGSGSIGKKHIGNLNLLGYMVDTCDPNGGDIKDMYELGLTCDYDLVLICTPKEHHIEALHFFNDRKVPYIFIEKPLCELEPTNKHLIDNGYTQIVMKELTSQVMMGYNYRFDRGIKKLKECLPRVGKILYASLENGYAFEKLKRVKEQDYHILLDDIHIVNIARWLFGEPTKVNKGYITPETANFSMEFISKEFPFPVFIHTDCVNQRYKKRIEVRGSEGNLVWNYAEHELFFCPADETTRRALPYQNAHMLMEEMKYIVDCVENKKPFEINTLEDGERDMQIVRSLIG